MEAVLTLKISCNNSAAVNYAMNIVSEMILKQKLKDWTIELTPRD